VKQALLFEDEAPPVEKRKRAPKPAPEPEPLPPPIEQSLFFERTIATTRFGAMAFKEVIVLDTVALYEMRDQLVRRPELTYDTETSGLVPALGARICGHAFATRSGPQEITAWYIPTRHIGDHNLAWKQLPLEVVSPVVQEVLASPGVMAGHHVKFDVKFARADDIRVAREILDVSILAAAANENEPKFGLKPLSKDIVPSAGQDEDEMSKWMAKDARRLKMRYKKRAASPGVVSLDELEQQTYLERFGYSRSPIDLCGRYACMDVFLALVLLWQHADVPNKFDRLIKREHKIGKILCDMEWRGLPADVSAIRATHERTGVAVQHWLTEVRRIIGDETYTGGDVELRKLLFGTLKLQPQKYTKGSKSKGKGPQKPRVASVDKEARLLLEEVYPEHKELLTALGQYAIVLKAHSTYAGNYLRYYSPTTRSIHPNYNQLEQRAAGGAPVTGRLSSSDPNNQNVPRSTIHLWDCGCGKCLKETPDNAGNAENTVSIRRYFTVPKGCIRVYLDFSQIELRILAWLCQDPTLLDAFARGVDLHQLIADQLAITRKIAKEVNFGNSFGMTELGLAIRMPGYYKDPEGTRGAARKVLEAYFARYVRIQQFRAEFANEMRRNGNSFVNVFGRPRRIPNIDAIEDWKRERAERQMMSSIVSGTSADLMKESMIRVAGDDGVLAQHGGEGYIAQAIHDEVALDIPLRRGWFATALACKAAMEDWPQFSDSTPARHGVPIKTNMALATSDWEHKREVTIHADGTFSIIA